MQLKIWLVTKRITQKKFAEMIGYCYPSITKVCQGRNPGKGLAKAIEHATNGEVTFPRIVKRRKELENVD